MSRSALTLLLLLPLVAGCGETWGRESAVEIPLHRDVLQLNPRPPSCTLPKPEWKKRCTRDKFDDKSICPEGCPLVEQ